MRGITLALTLAIVGCKQINFELKFPGQKTYQYKYEGVVMTGASENGLVRAGVKISSDVDITETAQNILLLQLLNPLIQEYNGVWPNAPFGSVTKLNRDLQPQLTQPVKFEYNNGKVGEIFIPASVSDTVVNIHRGLLSMLQLSVKYSRTTYQLQEPDIAGTCHTNYILQQDNGSDKVVVTKSKDLTNCEEKVQRLTGMAYLHMPNSYTEVTKNIMGTVAYRYTLKALKDTPGLLITEVSSTAVHQFSPSSDKNEVSLSETSQKMVLVKVKEPHGSFPDLEFQKRGPIQYQFASDLTSTILSKVQNLEAEAINILQQLVLKNVEKVHDDAPNQFNKLIHLLRRCTYDNINGVWKQYANTQQYRSWLLDALPTIGNSVSLTFIVERIRKSELTMAEACQVLISAMHLVQADQDTMKIAAEFISTGDNTVFPFLHNLALLAYGSMVNKFCELDKECPDVILKPLHDYATAALNAGKEEDLILALKALGNAGRPASIKLIMKVLPGLSSVAPELLTKVQADAVMSLRNIAQQDPSRVQDIALGIFMDQKQPPDIRMLASVVLLEAKPPLALLATVAEALSQESSLQVSSFVYSLMKSLSRSVAPGHKTLSAACSAAVKLLSLKLDWLGFRYSKAFHVNLYKYNNIWGAAASIYLVNSATSLLPKFFIFNVQAYLLDKVSEPLEIGVQAEGIEEVLMKDNGESQSKSPPMSIQKILMLLRGWKNVTSAKTLVSVYIKLFGQEIFFAHMDKKSIDEVLQVFGEPVSRYAMVWKTVAMLQEGKTLQLSKPIRVAEMRSIFPTSIGLPMEMSLLSTAVVTTSVTAQVKIMPAPTGQASLDQILNSEVQLLTDGTSSMAVNTIATVGINTDFVQAGRELHLMAQVNVPVKFTTKFDIREQNVKMQFDPCMRETDLLTVRTEAFSVTRNTEDPNLDKQIQLLAESALNCASKPRFRPEAMHSEGTDSAGNAVLSDEVMSMKTVTPSDERSQNLSAGHITCIEAPTFGFRVCLEMQSESDAKLGDMLLSKVVGFNFVISFKPAQNPVLENIEVEIQTGPRSAAKIIQMTTTAEKPMTTHPKGRVLRGLRGVLTTDKNLGDSFPPLFAIVCRIRGSDGNLRGYELALYADATASKPRAQILAMELGSMENWKVCVDAEKQNEYKALMVMRWGKDCQDYKITMEGITGRLATNPALKFKAKWERVPSTMNHAGKVLALYLPWAAVTLGFTELVHRNPSKQLSLYLAATSPRTLDMILKTPEITFCKTTVPLPFAVPFDDTQSPSGPPLTLTETLSMLADLYRSECIAEGVSFTTFDGVQYRYEMPRGCFHVLAQNCISSPRFIILMKAVSRSASLQALKAHINDNVIEIIPSASGELRLMYNNHEVPPRNLPFTDTHGEVVVKREGQGLVLSAERYGLDRVYFSGRRMELRVGSAMRGRTCGMCGRNDGETNLAFRTPDEGLAKSAAGFAHSWLLNLDSCKEDCKVQQNRLELGRRVSVFGELIHCYSAEPVLRCLPGCFPAQTALLNVSLHCHPADNTDHASLVGKDSDMVDSVMSHTECSCPVDRCSD